MLTTALIDRVLATVPHRTVGLVGDLFLDRYLDIDPARDEPSVETGLTAYQVTRVRSYPGALGTVLNNLVALGVGTLAPIAVIGDDGEGYELRQCLAKLPGVSDRGLVVSPDRHTPTYTKPMYGEKELNRLDIKNRTPTPRELEDRVLALLDGLLPTFDALLILDQVSEPNCGVVTDRVRQRLAEIGKERPNFFMLADSRERIAKFENVCVKPNRSEFERAGRPMRFGRHAFCTDGENGIQLVAPDGTRTAVPAYPVAGPIDICGAGDSCSAGIACAMVSGATHEEAAAFGNLIASITIQQIGTTGTASPQQVRDRWREVS
jgi:bifunctional ADP-heptose synthase (sugar kinase/adenylyltransferase)